MKRGSDKYRKGWLCLCAVFLHNLGFPDLPAKVPKHWNPKELQYILCVPLPELEIELL